MMDAHLVHYAIDRGRRGARDRNVSAPVAARSALAAAFPRTNTPRARGHALDARRRARDVAREPDLDRDGRARVDDDDDDDDDERCGRGERRERRARDDDARASADAHGGDTGDATGDRRAAPRAVRGDSRAVSTRVRAGGGRERVDGRRATGVSARARGRVSARSRRGGGRAREEKAPSTRIDSARKTPRAVGVRSYCSSPVIPNMGRGRREGSGTDSRSLVVVLLKAVLRLSYV